MTFAREFSREHPCVGAGPLLRGALGGHRARPREAGDPGDRRGRRRPQRPGAPRHQRRAPPAGGDGRAPAGQAGGRDRRRRPWREAVQIVLSERTLAGDPETPDQGVLSERTWRVANLATKHALIRGGLGWGHLPEHLVRRDLRAGRLVELRLDGLGDGGAAAVAGAGAAARGGAWAGRRSGWRRGSPSSAATRSSPRAKRITPGDGRHHPRAPFPSGGASPCCPHVQRSQQHHASPRRRGRDRAPAPAPWPGSSAAPPCTGWATAFASPRTSRAPSSPRSG